MLKFKNKLKECLDKKKWFLDYYQKNPSASQSLKGSIYEEKIIHLIKSKINLTQLKI